MTDRDNVRFLPAEGADEHEGTHIALLSGHACRVYEVSREDGKRGTWIDKRFRKAAIAAGCGILGLEEEPKAHTGINPGNKALIVTAIGNIIDSGNEDDIDANDRPKLSAVKRVAGFNVSKTELDAAWAEYINGLDA